MKHSFANLEDMLVGLDILRPTSTGVEIICNLSVNITHLDDVH